VDQTDPSNKQRIWQVVLKIPEGKVATYGDIARRAGLARAGRLVGHALKRLPPDTKIPWHRVVNARGHLSLPAHSDSYTIQRERLEQEGVKFDLNGKIDLGFYGWLGGARAFGSADAC
jgi:methylated-DNA-protein-cysteine methyltransferase-like protein